MWLVSLIKAIAWPGAILLIAHRLEPAFSKLISSLLNRPFTVEAPGGVRATIGAPEQQQTAFENPTSDKLPTSATLGPTGRPALDLIEKKIIEELKSAPPEHQNTALIRALAQSRLECSHEFSYNRIFGSQISALRWVNSVGKANKSDLKRYYEIFEQQAPSLFKDYGFDNWLSYLTNSSLLSLEGDLISITDIGRDFLIYITEKGLMENKSL